MKKKLKILQIVPSLSQANGVAAYVCNYFNYMKKENIEMTFLVLNNRDHGRYASIIEYGGKIVELYKDCNIFKYFKKIDSFFKNNEFDIVHCHVPNYGAIMLWFAKKNNIKIRILHSHVNKSADKLFNKIRNDIISPIAVRCANEYFACSLDAGKFLFKNKKFTIINNAIPLEKYLFSEEQRKIYRKKYNLDEKFVIGEFGRLCPQKNQLFTLEIFKKIYEQRKDAFLLLVGNGPMEEKINVKAKELGIENNIKLLGSRTDVNNLYNCLDCFLLPSTYEGLGIVLIEAQTNGLVCFASNKLVPNEAKVSELVHFIDLSNNPEEWSQKILNNISERVNVTNSIVDAGFDITTESNKLYEQYIRLNKNYNGD